MTNSWPPSGDATKAWEILSVRQRNEPVRLEISDEQRPDMLRLVCISDTHGQTDRLVSCTYHTRYASSAISNRTILTPVGPAPRRRPCPRGRFLKHRDTRRGLFTMILRHVPAHDIQVKTFNEFLGAQNQFRYKVVIAVGALGTHK